MTYSSPIDRRRLGETIDVTMLPTAGQAVEMGVAAPPTAEATTAAPRRRPPRQRGYFIFKNGRRWFVTWSASVVSAVSGECA